MLFATCGPFCLSLSVSRVVLLYSSSYDHIWIHLLSSTYIHTINAYNQALDPNVSPWSSPRLWNGINAAIWQINLTKMGQKSSHVAMNMCME